MQQEIASLHTDVQRKDSVIERAIKEKGKALDKLKELDGKTNFHLNLLNCIIAHCVMQFEHSTFFGESFGIVTLRYA